LVTSRAEAPAVLRRFCETFTRAEMYGGGAGFLGALCLAICYLVLLVDLLGVEHLFGHHL
jgi:hypothetical protein